MSLQAVFSQIRSPTRELLFSLTKNCTQHIGQSQNDQKEIIEWIERTEKHDITDSNYIQKLNDSLLPKTYLVDNCLSAADVAVYSALHPVMSKFTPSEYYAYPAITRFFDHIQSLPLVRACADSLGPSFSLVNFDFGKAPKMERKYEHAKKKEKKTTLETEDTVPQPKRAVTASVGSKKANSSDPSKKKSGGGGKAMPAPEESEPVPSMIDLRVGHIIDVIKHPEADTLYIEQIDIGEGTGPRTVVSGLVKYIPIEEMRDKRLVVVCNLKPANMRGVKSFAMVFCASSKTGTEDRVELLQPPENSKPGDRVYFEGQEFESATPLPQLNPKKKIFETIQPGFTTLDSREAAWVNPATKSVHRIRTKDGVCMAPSLVGASLS